MQYNKNWWSLINICSSLVVIKRNSIHTITKMFDFVSIGGSLFAGFKLTKSCHADTTLYLTPCRADIVISADREYERLPAHQQGKI